MLWSLVCRSTPTRLMSFSPAAAVPCRTRTRCVRDIETLLARFPMLATKRHDPAGTLSGGQQQILEMAIALLLPPAC